MHPHQDAAPLRRYLSRRQNGAPFGVSADNVTFDYAKIIERKNAVSKQLSNGVAFLEKSHASRCSPTTPP